MYICTYVYIHTCIYIYIYTHIHYYVYTYVTIYIYIYTHVYIYIERERDTIIHGILSCLEGLADHRGLPGLAALCSVV